MNSSRHYYFKLVCISGILLWQTGLAAENNPVLNLFTKINFSDPTFTLIGVVFRPGSKPSDIYVRTQDNNILSYKNNDSIEGAWKIIDIHPDSVSLQSKNRKIEISLQYPGKDRVVIDRESANPLVDGQELDLEFNLKLKDYINGRALDLVPYPNGVISYGIEKISELMFLIDKQSLLEQLEDKQANRHISFNFSDGINITEVVPGSLFDKAGMEPGDTITSANGEPINTVTDALAITWDLINSDTLNLEFKRDNDLFNYQYHIINAGVSGE